MFRCSIQRSIISSFWLLLCLITADIIHLWDFVNGTFVHVSAFYEKGKPASEDRNGASCGFSGNSYVGHVLNGFTYVSNRWSFVLAFLVALISVKMLPELKTLTRKEK